MNDKGYTNPQLLISVEELMSRLGDGSICLVDVRPTHEYVEDISPVLSILIYLQSVSATRANRCSTRLCGRLVTSLRTVGLIRPRQLYGTKTNLALRRHADSGSASIWGMEMSGC